jgi:hypothetical protein
VSCSLGCCEPFFFLLLSTILSSVFLGVRANTPSFVAIIFTFFAMILLATFPGWYEEEDSEGSEREVKPFPSRTVSQIALALYSFAFLFSFITVLWQHIGSAAAHTLAKTLTYDSIDVSVGAGAMALGWVGVGCIGVTAFGLLVIILAIRVLASIIDS